MQDTVFRLYRRAQKFLALPMDEAIEPSDFSDEAELLVAELAVALCEAVPESASPTADRDKGEKE